MEWKDNGLTDGSLSPSHPSGLSPRLVASRVRAGGSMLFPSAVGYISIYSKYYLVYSIFVGWLGWRKSGYPSVECSQEYGFIVTLEPTYTGTYIPMHVAG